MGRLEEILNYKVKPKEKVILLAEECKKEKIFIKEIINHWESATVSERGHLIESLERVSKDLPELVIPYVGFIIKNLEDKAPRVKWECARIIGNLAGKFPEETERAVTALLKRTNDKGTVVRWSAAFALGEIAKNNPKLQKTLLPRLKELASKETNSGVKKVYLKAFQEME